MCVCIDVCVCMHVCVCVCVVCTHTHTHTYIYIYIYYTYNACISSHLFCIRDSISGTRRRPYSRPPLRAMCLNFSAHDPPLFHGSFFSVHVCSRQRQGPNHFYFRYPRSCSQPLFARPREGGRAQRRPENATKRSAAAGRGGGGGGGPDGEERP